MSKLSVKVEKISKIYKHPNADRLSIVEMLDNNYSCIVNLNQYEVGDLIIYCPIDSIIPENIIEEYKLEYLKKDNRVKTVKLRGFISQGLVLNIPRGKNWKEGRDVTKELGIKKYEPFVPKYQQFKQKDDWWQLWSNYINEKISFKRFVKKSLGIIKDGLFRKKKKNNPEFSKYTEIENMKKYKNVFEEGELVVISEKCHGSSFRSGYVSKEKNMFGYVSKKQSFYIGSHNVQLYSEKQNTWYGENIYIQIAKKYKLAEIIPNDYIIYGEIYGKGIQKNYDYGLKDIIDVVFFDVKYEGKYLDFEEFKDFCITRDLPTVPILFFGKFGEGLIEKYIGGKSVLAPCQKIREGIVIKPVIEIIHPRIGRKI